MPRPVYVPPRRAREPRYTRRAEIEIIYRLLVPLPITVEWNSARQTLRYSHSTLPPFTDVNLHLDDSPTGFAFHRYKSEAHARWVFQHGLVVQVSPPTLMTGFFAHLARDGRAEVLAGPHCPLRLWDLPKDTPSLDAYWTWPGLIDPSQDCRGNPREKRP